MENVPVISLGMGEIENNAAVGRVPIASVGPRKASMMYSLLTAIACFVFDTQTMDRNLITNLIPVVYSYTLSLVSTINATSAFLFIPFFVKKTSWQFL